MRIKAKFNAMKNMFAREGAKTEVRNHQTSIRKDISPFAYFNLPVVKFFKTITKKVSGRKIRSRKEFAQRPNKAGSKLSRRLYKSQMREQRRKDSLKRNAGKATKPISWGYR